MNKDFRKRLFHSHSFFGIAVALLLYISFFFGLFAIYLPYISVWEKPSRYFENIHIQKIEYEKMLNPIFLEKNVSNSKIELILPKFKGDPALHVSRPFLEEVIFNPNTNKKIIDEKTSHLTSFLNEMHYGKPLGVISFIVFGIMAVLTIVLIINGLMMVTKYKFKDNLNTKKGFTSFWHRKIFIWLFVPFLLVILVGAIFGTSLLSVEIVSKITTGKSANANVGKIIFPKENLPKKEDFSQMLEIADLVKIAKNINKNINFEKIILYNWQDKTATIKFEGYNPKYPFLNGFTNKPNIVLKADSGKLIKQTKVYERSWVILLADFIAFLHLLFGVDIFSRSIVALMMLVCGIGIVFSILLYQEKRIKRLKSIYYYHWFSKLCIAVIIGAIPATASLFVTQWILPFDLEYRLTYQQGIFFDIWIATLAYAFYELNSIKTIKNLLNIGGFLFAFSVILRWYKYSINFDISALIGVDIALLLLGGLCVFLSYKTTKKVLNV